MIDERNGIIRISTENRSYYMEGSTMNQQNALRGQYESDTLTSYPEHSLCLMIPVDPLEEPEVEIFADNQSRPDYYQFRVGVHGVTPAGVRELLEIASRVDTADDLWDWRMDRELDDWGRSSSERIDKMDAWDWYSTCNCEMEERLQTTTPEDLAAELQKEELDEDGWRWYDGIRIDVDEDDILAYLETLAEDTEEEK